MLCLSGFDLYSRWVPLIIFNQLNIVPWTAQKGFSRNSVSDLPLVALLHFAQYLSRVWAGYHAVLWMEGQRSTCHHQSSAELSWSGKQRKLINESKFKKPCWSPKTLSLTGVGHFYHAINSCNISHWFSINPQKEKSNNDNNCMELKTFHDRLELHNIAQKFV